MIYTFTGRGLDITGEIREYAEKRFEHIARLTQSIKMEPLLRGEFELRQGERIKYVARVTFDQGGEPLHVECSGATLHEAIDAAGKALVAEVAHAKGKQAGFARRHAAKVKNFLRGLRR